MANGDKYSGEWREGKRHGQGTYYYRFVCSLLIPIPKLNSFTMSLIYSDGDRYDGEWKTDERVRK